LEDVMNNVTRKFFGKDGRKGSAIVEAALMMPWIAFLFVGVLDFGYYAYASIATQNAARAGAIRGANEKGDLSNVCGSALGELRVMPNMSGVLSCGAAPLWVTSTILNNSTTPPCADCGPKPTATSVQVVVTYESVPMIPIPGVLTGKLHLARTAEARVIN
jgi:Flp pilus assembly protein TadG